MIVTGRDRQEALERSRRALAEFDVEGIATAITFDRVVVEDPDFAPADPNEAFKVHTRWIETDFNNTIPAYVDAEASDEVAEASARQDVVVEVGGKRVAVSLPADLAIGGGTAKKTSAAKRGKRKKAGAAASGDAVATPMQGTIVKVAVEEGQQVEAGDLVVVLEAMKMEQPLNAHKAGTVTGLTAETGATVPTGTVLCEIKD